MLDQSFCAKTLVEVMTRGDFNGVPPSAHELFRLSTAMAAEVSAQTLFGGRNPIEKIHLKKKPAFRIAQLADDLVVRRLSKNIRRIVGQQTVGRNHISTALRNLLTEGVPYRIHRLDIKSFYESLDSGAVLTAIEAKEGISPLSKDLLRHLLTAFTSMGPGVPRGMAVSAVLSDLMMASFDQFIRQRSGIYFYGRYVDDIVIVTNTRDHPNELHLAIQAALPAGLSLNQKKSSVQEIADAFHKPIKKASKRLLTFEYLGYQYDVSNPAKTTDGQLALRNVTTDIASKKVKRLQSRLVRSIRDFAVNHDANLLIDRFRYLTNNFAIHDYRTGKRELAGIFYGYPLVQRDAKSLVNLDMFLRSVVLDSTLRGTGGTTMLIGTKLRRKLLGCSFVRGHRTRNFVHFSSGRIGQIQMCWRYE